jgi:DNA-binding transcriptional LysR family regulator
LSSEELIRQLDQFELDVGISYLNDPRLKGFQCLPLYREHHVLLTRDMSHHGISGPISWKDAAKLPLCLLSQDMQNRKLIDAAFREADVIPRVALETDSVMALYSHVRCSHMCSIVPHSLLFLFELRQEVNAVAILPELTNEIGLIARKDDPTPPLVKLAFETAAELNLQARLDALIDIIN